MEEPGGQQAQQVEIATGQTTLTRPRASVRSPLELPSQDDSLIRDAIKARLFPNLEQLSMPADAGRVGRFAVLERIGKGGMGVVYSAYDDRLDRKIAIKLMRSRFDGPRGRELLEREAKRLAQLSHPNVVQVHEIGEHDDGVYVAMEYVAGRTLRKWLEQERPWTEILPVLIQAGRGLVAAHAAGLVHRDFKPDNVMVGDDGRVRVLDFGLASFARATLTRTSHDGYDDEHASTRVDSARASLVGTPAYMAPELLGSGHAHAGSDQWAFCVVAYEALFGVRPFVGGSLAELMDRILESEPGPAPAQIKLPRGLERAILRGLSKQSEARWPELAALVSELESMLAPRSRSARSLGVAGLLGAGLAAALALAVQEQPQQCVLDEHALAGSWDAERRHELARGVAGSGHAVVERELDAWADRWLAARQRACVATWIESAQSPEWLDQHNACLELQRHRFDAVVELLVEADPSTVERAGELLLGLPDPSRCASPLAMRGAGSLPEDARARAQIELRHGQLGRVAALGNTGQVEAAGELLDEILADPQVQAYPPLAIEARAEQGRLAFRRWDIPAGLASMQAAITGAVREQLEDLEIELRIDLARAAVGPLGELALERWLVDEAAAALATPGAHTPGRALRVALAKSELAVLEGDPALALAQLRRARTIDAPERALRGPELELDTANVLAQLGEHDEAERTYQRAAELSDELWGHDSPRTAEIELAAGITAVEAGRHELAARHLERASSIYPGELGDSVFEARVASASAAIVAAEGDFEGAAKLLEAALATFARELGEAHDETARAANGLGVILFMRGDLEGSLLAYRRALVAQEHNLGARHREVGLLHSNIGESLLALGRVEQARESFALALDILEPQLPSNDPLLALPLKGRGLARLAVADADAAIADLERALAITRNAPDETFELAEQRFGLARALLLDTPNEPDVRDRARTLSHDARVGFEELGLDDRVAELDAWCELHDLD